MPWTSEHKKETRRRVIDAAAAAFRAHGVSGIALSDVMGQAGLTHGGFYSHFSSKDDLVATALGEVTESRIARFEEMARTRAPGAGLLAAAESYLTSQHREHPESGCFIATLGSELARGGGPSRSRLSYSIRAWLAHFARHAPARRAEKRRQAATGTFAAMIGGMILARGAEDPHESDQILADVRAFIREALEDAR